MNPETEYSSKIGATLDLILKTLIASSDFTNVQSKNWDAIARLIPGTTAIQCARRYEELLMDGGELAIQHLSQKLTKQNLVSNNNTNSLGDLESSARQYNNNSSRPSSSKSKSSKEDKGQASGNTISKNIQHKGPVMVIHVCDEAKNLKKDFQCPRDLLVQEMKYFAEYLSTDAQRWEEVDISVHCDVQIFDWLIKYVKRDTKEVTESPKLEPNNVVSILISSDFLKMDTLVTECINFCHKNMSSIVSTPCNMNCINDRLLTRIAELFSHNEADEVKDRKDKFKSKLFSKKLEKLFEYEGSVPDSPEKASTLFRCSVCKRLLTKTLRKKVKCAPSRMTIDRVGKLIYSHLPDPKFDMNEHILELKQQLKTWRDVYWRLWGTVNFLNCSKCQEIFPLTEFAHCSYHPENARYDSDHGIFTSNIGLYPCCHQKCIRFDPVRTPRGCRVKDHLVLMDFEGSGDKIVMTPEQKIYDDFLQRRDVICTPYQRQSEIWDQEPNVFANETFACHTHNPLVNLPSLSGSSDDKKLENKPRLQALTVEKEVSYFIDETDGTETDDEIGDNESPKDVSSNKRVNKGTKKSRVTVEPKAILLDAPDFEQKKKAAWDTHRSLRYNQDAQRQEDARRMKEIRLYLTKLRLGAEKVEKPKREHAGGLYSKLESQWRVNNLPNQGKQAQTRNRPKPFGSLRL